MHTARQVGTLTGKARPPCLLAAGTVRVFGIAFGSGLALGIATLTRGLLLGGASVVLALGHSHAGVFFVVVVAGVWRGGVLIVGVGRHAVFLTSAAAAAPVCHHLPYFLLGPRCLGGPRCACRPPSIYSLCRSMERPTACSAQRSVAQECPPRDSVTRIASAVPRRASARSLLRSTGLAAARSLAPMTPAGGASGGTPNAADLGPRCCGRAGARTGQAHWTPASKWERAVAIGTATATAAACSSPVRRSLRCSTRPSGRARRPSVCPPPLPLPRCPARLCTTRGATRRRRTSEMIVTTLVVPDRCWYTGRRGVMRVRSVLFPEPTLTVQQ